MAFTSGRLKAMTPLFDHCVGQLLNHLDSIVSKSENKGTNSATFEPLPVLFSFSIDAVSASVFATNVNSYQGISSGQKRCPLLRHALNFFYHFTAEGVVLLCTAAPYQRPLWSGAPVKISRQKSRGKNLAAKISRQKSRKQKSRKQKSRVAKISHVQNLEFVFILFRLVKVFNTSYNSKVNFAVKKYYFYFFCNGAAAAVIAVIGNSFA